MWYTYILECNDKTLYCGITNNIAKRLLAHKQGKGAKYTKTHGANKFVYIKTQKNKSSALREEFRIKNLKRKDKLILAKAYKFDEKSSIRNTAVL
ncbi:MAG: hypothetical protein JWO40_581 [Candidatus Doudnabacteria bacterium]|nr:hypothetical protein [Candidatus Doudnabacteria bacterium]